MAQIETVRTTVGGQHYVAYLVKDVLFFAPCEVQRGYVGWCMEHVVSIALRESAAALHPLPERILLVQAYIKLYLSMAGTPDD